MILKIDGNDANEIFNRMGRNEKQFIEWINSNSFGMSISDETVNFIPKLLGGGKSFNEQTAQQAKKSLNPYLRRIFNDKNVVVNYDSKYQKTAVKNFGLVLKPCNFSAI